jgi:hypothetical protein
MKMISRLWLDSSPGGENPFEIMRVPLPVLVTTVLLFTGVRPGFAGETYSNGFPADPKFFPICVWLQSTHHAAEFKAIGVNTFIGFDGGPTEQKLDDLEKNGLFAMAAQSDAALALPNVRVIKGWTQMDEPDNAQPDGKGGYGPCIPAADIVKRAREMKEKDPTRPDYVNFGMGVAAHGWYGRGPNTGDMAYYDTAVQGSDILSFDIYPVSINPKEHAERGRLQYVAEGVMELEKRARDGQQVWCWLETTALDPTRAVKPDEAHTEVWMALIHGAKGIGYFVDEFKPQFREDAIFNHPDVVAEVTKNDQLITKLAPVLNSPTLPDAVTVEAKTPVDTMAKSDAGSLYLFTVAMKNEPTTARFTLKNVQDATAEVLEENRTVAIKGGVLEDSFPGYGVHLYKIPLQTGP